MIRAGTPATTQLSGMSFVTTEFAATITLFPILIFPKAFAPGKKTTLLPIVGQPSFLSLKFQPIVQP